MRFPAALVLACLIAAPASAHGLGPCLARAEFLAQLAAQYGEAPVGFGLTPDGRVLEILVSPETGSWTIIVTAADGVACGLAAGEGWRPAQPEAPGSPPA